MEKFLDEIEKLNERLLKMDFNKKQRAEIIKVFVGNRNLQIPSLKNSWVDVRPMNINNPTGPRSEVSPQK
ncbi:MAG: hypothetical protein SOY60_09395 [Fusobacterium gastrosuis]|uniref:hypothetical protein n=1 Tax=Fusobacterium gastrosuis TaxID=1755100 RepID=UPI002A89D798|nr:hypothetical protein [Fusobacterium gastrosuis]